METCSQKRNESTASYNRRVFRNMKNISWFKRKEWLEDKLIRKIDNKRRAQCLQRNDASADKQRNSQSFTNTAKQKTNDKVIVEVVVVV